MKHLLYSVIVVFCLVSLPMCAAAPTAGVVQVVPCFPIPTSVKFADQIVSLERYDMRERYDREQMAVAYSHSSSLLILKRANRYFPLLEPILKQQGIPDDFKYLAVTESNLDLRAKSPVQAAGLWQLMPKTAQELGLEVNDEVDERYHLEKSTVAACKYFKRAFSKYKDWNMVAASYNGGMGRISGEADKQQVSDFFDMLLTAETSRYVFRIFVMKQFLENPKAFGYLLQKEDFYTNVGSKTLTVTGSVDDWTSWAAQHGISYYQLKEFNVWLRDRKLTNASKREYRVEIPEKGDLKFDPAKIKIHNPNWIN
jgi:membrane-bound lytic murein transglycosylase D